MATKILDDADQGFDSIATLYLSRDEKLGALVLEVERNEDSPTHRIEEIYLSKASLITLINALNYHLYQFNELK